MVFLFLLCVYLSEFKSEIFDKKKDSIITIERLTLDELSNPEKNIYITTDENYIELAEKIMGEVTRKKFPGSIWFDYKNVYGYLCFETDSRGKIIL